VIVGGERGTAYGDAFWTAAFALYDAIWPHMSAKLAAAEGLGFPWAPTTHPFAWIEDGQALAYTGVLLHPVRLAGEDRVIAGVHAVCTHPTARGRGLARACMDSAIDWIDAHGLTAKLGTDLTDFYQRWDFRSVPNHRFVSARSGGVGPARRLSLTTDAQDAALFRDALTRRTAISDVYATRDDGWLVAINLALAGGLDSWAWHLPDLDAVLLAEHRDDELVIHDLLAPELPPMDELLRQVALPFARVRWMFPPDLLDPAATPVPRPASSGHFMVRGPWPATPPFGFSVLWEH